MMNGYNEKSHYDDEPEPSSFVKAFDAFRKGTRASLLSRSSSLPTYQPFSLESQDSQVMKAG